MGRLPGAGGRGAEVLEPRVLGEGSRERREQRITQSWGLTPGDDGRLKGRERRRSQPRKGRVKFVFLVECLDIESQLDQTSCQKEVERIREKARCGKVPRKAWRDEI